MSRIPMLGLLFLAAGGCVHTQAAMLTTSTALPPICAEGVQLFTASDQIGKPYRELAILQASGEAHATTDLQLLESQRKKAAALGANGVILGYVREQLPDSGHQIRFFGANPQRTADAIAVLIPDDSARVRAACGKRG